MDLEISITDGSLPPASPSPASYPGAGALISFEGIVRPHEDGRPIDALDYSTYEPMAQNMLEKIARAIGERQGLLAMRIEHSRGRVPAGQVSFRLTIAAPHRKQALAAMDEFIDRMKQDVPIWKAVP